MKFFKSKIDTSLLKLGFFNTFALTIRTVFGLLSTKILASFLGVQAFGFFGIYREFLMLIYNLSTLGISNGIIKYTAGNKTDKTKLSELFSTLLILGILSSIFFGIFLFFFAEYLSIYLFKSVAYKFLLEVTSFFVIAIVFGSFLMAILTGLGKTNKVIFVTIITAVLTFVLYLLLIPSYSLKGAVLAILFVYLVVLCYLIFNSPKQLLANITWSVSWIQVKNLSAYSLMTGFSLIAFPIMGVLIKNEISTELGQDALGYWEGLRKISFNYLIFGTTLLTLFVIPKISEDSTYQNFRKTLLSFLKTVFPLFLLFLFLIYVFRKPFVELCLTKDYVFIVPFMKWFLVGDVFRILSLMMATYFHATRAWKEYLITDVVLAFFQYFFTIFLIKRMGLEGASMAYCISFIVYFFITATVLSRMSVISNRNSIE